MNAQHILQEIMEAQTMTLLHFSDKAYLTKVSPKFQGAAQAGQERESPDYRKPPFTHWYVKSSNSFIEPIFWNSYAYAASIWSGELHNQKKPLENSQAKRMGYKGVYYNLGHGDEQARLFVPMPVKLLGKVEIPQGKQYGQITGENIFRYIHEVASEPS